MSVIATICARGGSVGVPGKNIKPLCGKPLIVYSIEQALTCNRIDRVFVSTDDELIAETAKKAGAEVPFIRPAELSTSSAPKLEVIRHLVEWLEKEGVQISTVVDLDPTSPLRSEADIESCLNLLDDEADVVITACEADKNPYFNMVEKKPDGNIRLVKPISGGVVARQAAPQVYSMNASIYAWHRHTLEKGLWDGRTRLHVMPRERSIDIDEPIDFQLVELLMKCAHGDG